MRAGKKKIGLRNGTTHARATVCLSVQGCFDLWRGHMWVWGALYRGIPKAMKNLDAGIVAMAEDNGAVPDDAPAPDSAEASGHGALTLDSAVDNLETITPY